MNDFEIIFFAGVAVFFAYKLWAAFGKTNSEDASRAAERANYAEKLVAASRTTKPEQNTVMLNPAVVVEKEEEIPENLKTDVSKAREIDPSFTLQRFKEGAVQAFEMVVQGFAQKKRDVLQFLLSDDVYSNFNNIISKREDEGLDATTTVVAIDNAEIIDIEIKGNICQIMVKFVSEQIHFIKNKAGEIIEGSKSQIDRVTDVWTFERNLTSKKPNWTVVGIQSA